MTPDLISASGATLTPIDDAPGYARSESGRVYKLGNYRKGRSWRGLRETAETDQDTMPGHRVIRRTGRFYFPIFHTGGRMERLWWTPPVESHFIPLPIETEDDCPS